MTIKEEGRAAFLVANPTFAHLSREQRGQMARLMGERKVRAGEMIFAAGDAADLLYIIVSGSVKIFVVGSDGKEQLFNFLSRDDIFGEIALLDNKPRTASAAAVNDCHFLTLTRSQFLELLRDPDLVAGLFGVLVGRIRHISQIAQILTMPLRKKVAFVLCDLAARHGRTCNDGIEITLDLSDEDIADHVHATRPSVNPVIKEFVDIGLVSRRTSPSGYVLRDRTGLMRIFDVEGVSAQL